MTALLNNYLKTRQRTEHLCQPLQPEDFTPQSADFASPPKWHIAHTTWFFEEMILKQFDKSYVVFDTDFSFLFNSYYNSIGERIERHHRGLITRPSAERIFEYRKYVDDHISNLLEATVSSDLETLIILGINHEQQHQELLVTDLKYTFSCNPLYPKLSDSNFVSHKNSETGWNEIPEGIYHIGHDAETFSFDNELNRHRVFLEPYKISKGLVTNGEFIQFMEDKGYETANFWLDEGWHWVQTQDISKPLYWKKKGDVWYQYTLSGLRKVEMDDILCHISLYEAAAFAEWSGCRLPTEFEWEVASLNFNWGTRWEWTNSAYLPYPNFKTAEGAVGEYNGKFMMNQMVLRGASSATAEGHSRTTYRNFFPPQTQWQFSGIRLAK